MEGRYGGGCGSVSKCMAEFVDQGSAESLRYYLSRKTILEMLRDRGYDVADLEVTRSLAEFRVEFGDKPELKRLRISASLRSNQRRQVDTAICITCLIIMSNIIVIYYLM